MCGRSMPCALACPLSLPTVPAFLPPVRPQMALFREQARDVDIIITTALMPGKRAPVLITRDMVRGAGRDGRKPWAGAGTVDGGEGESRACCCL